MSGDECQGPPCRIVIYVSKAYEGKALCIRLDELAKKQERTRSYVVIDAILEYLERHEDPAQN